MQTDKISQMFYTSLLPSHVIDTLLPYKEITITENVMLSSQNLVETYYNRTDFLIDAQLMDLNLTSPMSLLKGETIKIYPSKYLEQFRERKGS